MALPTYPRESYNVGIICALDVEKAAVEATLDEEHGRVDKVAGDDNVYSFGKIGEHNVVIACLPAGVMGTVSAATVARDMMRSFSVTVGLMVGIGGGVWSKKTDVRLGDIVVSQPEGLHGGVIQWDFGKMEKEGVFRRTGTLNKPPRPLLNAIQSLKATHRRKGSKVPQYLQEMLSNYPLMEEEYRHPGQEHDELFESNYSDLGGDDCEGCDRSRVVQRLPGRKDEKPKIHYGNIASGDEVIKDGPTRDRIAHEEGILCFEMEAAGLMDTFPCIVVRGICDYADSHKNKKWQPYAAATAACYAKELLGVVDPQGVEELGMSKRARLTISAMFETVIDRLPPRGEVFTASSLSTGGPLQVDDNNVRGQRNLGTDLIKLGKLSTSLSGQRDGQSAQKIADRLATLMACLRDSSPGCALCRNHSEDQWVVLTQSLKGCARIAINSTPPKLREMTVAEFQRNTDSCELEEGELTMTTITQHSCDDSGHEVLQGLSALRFRPASGSKASPFVAFFGGQIDRFQKTVIHPTILTYRMVSSDSEVFDCIKKDDLEGFEQLLLSQDATTRDCDERGTSLLAYACHFLATRCCKFLIESGADVNRVEAAVDTYIRSDRTPLMAHPFNDDEASEVELSQSLLCRKMLFQAGADPTITTTADINDSPVVAALEGSDIQGTELSPTMYFDLIIRYANPYYIDWQRITVYGRSAWLGTCASACLLGAPLILDRLLAAGCNVQEVDQHGWNCLFHCVLGARSPSFSKELRVLVRLLSLFHDIYAKDHDGMTIFDHVRNTSGTYGSYPRDLWITALARAGYEYAEPDLRQAVYTSEYLPEYHLAVRHLHTWKFLDVTEQLRLSGRERWSLKRDIFQVMARLQCFREETLISQGLRVTARTIRVGTKVQSVRPQVIVAKGSLRSIRVNGKRTEKESSGFFRSVRMAEHTLMTAPAWRWGWGCSRREFHHTLTSVVSLALSLHNRGVYEAWKADDWRALARIKKELGEVDPFEGTLLLRASGMISGLLSIKDASYDDCCELYNIYMTEG